MDFQFVIVLLGFSLFMILGLNWIYFFDWDGLIHKLVRLIAPKKCFKEIENSQKLRGQDIFKLHIKKWKKIFWIHPLTFVVAFFTILLATKKILIALWGGVIVVFIEYAALCNKENNERQKIIDMLNDKKYKSQD